MGLIREQIIDYKNKPYIVGGVYSNSGVEYASIIGMEDGDHCVVAVSLGKLYPVDDPSTLKILNRYFAPQLIETAERIAKIIKK